MPAVAVTLIGHGDAYRRGVTRAPRSARRRRLLGRLTDAEVKRDMSKSIFLSEGRQRLSEGLGGIFLLTDDAKRLITAAGHRSLPGAEDTPVDFLGWHNALPSIARQ